MKHTLLTAALLLLLATTASAQFVVTKKDGAKVNVADHQGFTLTDGVPSFGGVPFGDIARINRSIGDITLRYMDYGAYYQGIKSASTDGSANYYFCLSDVPSTTSDDGMLLPGSKGMIMMFDLYADKAADPEHALIPNGRYTIADSARAGFCNTQFSFARVRSHGDSISYVLAQSGWVDVQSTNNVYIIEAHIVARDGQELNMSYLGKIPLENKSSSAEDSWMKENIVNTQYKGLTITDYGGDDDYFRYTLQLFDGTSTDDGVIDNGTVLHVDLFAQRPVGDGLYIPDGTYKASADYNQIKEFQPGTFLSGEVFTALGYPIYIGTYVQDMRKAKDENLIRYGYCNGGTVTIKRDGTTYNVDVDLTTRNGLSVTGHYQGKADYIDKRPQKTDNDLLSTLKTDKNLEFSDDTYAYAHRYSSFNGSDSLAEFEIVVNDHKSNESFQLDLVVPSTCYSPEGDYEAAPTMEAAHSYTFVPGYYTFSVMNGTWAWEQFESDGYYPVAEAPGVAGNLHIKKNADGTFLIKYDMQDDAKPAHTVRCAWLGTINDPRGTWSGR